MTCPFSLLNCTQEQVRHIETLISTMGDPNSGYAKVMSLSLIKPKIITVHPIKFLDVIFSNRTLAKKLLHMEKISYWAIVKTYNMWDEFISGLEEGIRLFQHNQHPPVEGFAKKYHLDCKILRSHLRERKLSELVKYIMKELKISKLGG